MASFLVDGETLAIPAVFPFFPFATSSSFLRRDAAARRASGVARRARSGSGRTTSSCSSRRGSGDAGAGGRRSLSRGRHCPRAAALPARHGHGEGARGRRRAGTRDALRAQRANACAPSSSRCRRSRSTRRRAEAHLRRAITLFEEYVAVHRRLPSELVSLIQSSDSPARQTFGSPRTRNAPRSPAGTTLKRRTSPPCFARSARR